MDGYLVGNELVMAKGLMRDLLVTAVWPTSEGRGQAQISVVCISLSKNICNCAKSFSLKPSSRRQVFCPHGT